jgi:hypothetical protein
MGASTSPGTHAKLRKYSENVLPTKQQALKWKTSDTFPASPQTPRAVKWAPSCTRKDNPSNVYRESFFAWQYKTFKDSRESVAPWCGVFQRKHDGPKLKRILKISTFDMTTTRSKPFPSPLHHLQHFGIVFGNLLAPAAEEM